MMRPDNKGRSASPHRITYKSDFHAIKCSFDTGASLQPRTKAAAASTVHPNMLLSNLTDSIVSSTGGSRGRIQSARGTKLRENIFLQMDCQQPRQDGVPTPSSCSTPFLPPPNPSFQLYSSPFSRSRHTLVSSSCAMSSVTSISSSETPLRDKSSRAEEMGELDRVAQAQRFSVARKLFETKMMEGGSSSGQSQRPLIGRGNVDATDGTREKEQEASGKMRCIEEESDKNKTGNHVLNVSKPKSCLAVLPTRDSKSSALNGPGEVRDGCDQTTDLLTEVKRKDEAALNPCFTPEQTLRAELVDVENESSESDENEEERVWTEVDTRWTKSTDRGEGRRLVAELDDVFEETLRLLKSVELRTGEDRSVASSEDVQRNRLNEDGGEGRRDEYQQVNKEWEGKREEQSRHSTTQVKLVEEGDDMEKKTQSGLGQGVVKLDRILIQEVNADKDVEGKVKREGGDNESRRCQSEARQEGENMMGKGKGTPENATGELKHVACRGSGEREDYSLEGKEDQTVISGIENKSFVYGSHPELSGPLRQKEESSPQRDEQMLVKYEEIPGLPELGGDDEEEPKAGRRKVRFSTAPIKVQ